MIQDFDILGLEDFFFLCTLLRVLNQGISIFIYFALTIIHLKVITKKFLGLIDLSRAQTLHIHKSSEVIVVGKHENFMLRVF